MLIQELIQTVPQKHIHNMFFKMDFILSNFKISRANFPQKTVSLLRIGEELGYKCSCCNSTDIRFKLHETGKFIPFIKNANTYVELTQDHNLLKCLGGSPSRDNMTLMCRTCNQLRDSDFAQLSEFKDYYDFCMTEYGEYRRPDKPNFCFIDPLRNLSHRSVANMSNGNIKLNPEVLVQYFIDKWDGEIPAKGIKLQNFMTDAHVLNYKIKDMSYVIVKIMQHVITRKGFKCTVPMKSYHCAPYNSIKPNPVHIFNALNTQMKKDLQFYLRECMNSPQPGDVGFVKIPDYNVERDTLGKGKPKLSLMQKISKFIKEFLAS